MNLEKLDINKKERIINASLKLFGSSGYKHTSTDLITKEAEISKGLLFHYFGTKKKLYLYLYDYSINFIIKEVGKHNLDGINDFFEYTLKAIEAKWGLMRKHPHIYEFLISTLKEDDKEIRSLTDTKLLAAQNNSWQEITKRIDKEKFKNPDDLESIITLIKYSSNGFMKEFIEADNIDIEKQTEEFKKILDTLKRNFYKEEYL